MKDTRKTEIRVGITVIAGIIIFLWILGWAKNFSLTDKDSTLDVKFSRVDGLEIGDYVTVNGVRKGFVDNIFVDADGVIVRMSIDNDINLKEDAQFSVTMLDLMGGKKVNIEPGKSATKLDYSKQQTGNFNADIPEVMSILGGMQGDLIEAMSDIKITLKSLNNYLEDDELNKNLKGSLSNLTEVSRKINLMIDENRDGIKILTRNSVELTEEAKSFLAENKEDFSKSMEELSSILKNTDSLLISLNQLADETKSRENNLGKILYDEQVYKNLHESLTQLNELSKIIIEQIKGDGVKVDVKIF
jgi:phospholipid/cholesterol/gamma-HCH transport system substrate-binding protein